MSKFQKKQFKKIIYSPIVLIILAFAVLVSFYGVLDIIPKYLGAAKTKKNILEKKEIIEERQKQIEAELYKFESANGMEETIREKLNVTKDGEHVIIVVDTPVSKETTEEPVLNFWQRLFE